MCIRDRWEGFEGNRWKEQINVRDFIRHNYTPYDGDDSFLEGPTEATDKLWGKLQELQKAERANNGVLDMETKVVTGLTAYGPGYIAEDLKNLEKVVGLQTDKPLKRAFMPYGGIKMAEQACEMYGYKVDPQIHDCLLYTSRQALCYFAIIFLFAIGAGIGGRLSMAYGERAIWVSSILLLISFLLMFIEEIEEAEHRWQ